MSPTFYLTDAEHRRALTLVRRMELQDAEWSGLLEALETDRPVVGYGFGPGPVASRKAPASTKLAEAARRVRPVAGGLSDGLARAEKIRNDENGEDTGNLR